MANKHFIIYYKNGTGTYIVTEPRPWARENQNLFPDFDFTNITPTTNRIIKWLIENRGFQKQIFEERGIVVISNLNPLNNL
jgi:hypothetical protein